MFKTVKKNMNSSHHESHYIKHIEYLPNIFNTETNVTSSACIILKISPNSEFSPVPMTIPYNTEFQTNISKIWESDQLDGIIMHSLLVLLRLQEHLPYSFGILLKLHSVTVQLHEIMTATCTLIDCYIRITRSFTKNPNKEKLLLQGLLFPCI